MDPVEIELLESILNPLQKFAERQGWSQTQLQEKLIKVTSHKGKPFSNCDLPFLTTNLGLIPQRVGDYWTPPKVDFTPSERFLSLMKEIPQVWSLNSEKSKRTVIDMFLLEVLTSKRKGDTYPFKIWCEYNISTDKVQGFLDYLAAPQNPFPVSPHILALEAKPYWPEDGYCQLLAEMFALLELNRKSSLSSTTSSSASILPVYGILSNESDWQFFKLESDLKWYQSTKYIREKETIEILSIISAMFEHVNAESLR